MNRIYSALLFILLSVFSLSSYAWNHSIDIGYGYSHDPNHSRYNNSGVLLSGDLYPFYRSERLFWSLNGALGQWHSTAPTHQNMTTGALSMALRFYMFNLSTSPAYLLGSVGPAVMSQHQFGLNKQGSNIAFQLNGGLGIELNKKFDLNMRMVHFSNGNLAHPNHGFNVLYLLSVGYLFC